MAHFLCTLVHGPAWDDSRGIREQDGWDAHAAFMDRLVDDGVIIVGGPVGRGVHSAHLMSGPSAAALRERLAEDPWARDGHLSVGSLDAWSLWLDGRGLDGPGLDSRGLDARGLAGQGLGGQAHPGAACAAGVA